MTHTFSIRPATAADLAAMLAMFPRLADFDLPPRRKPEDLWRGDSELLTRWAGGQAPQCLVQVAVDPHDTILGVALTQLREELLSHDPSAHLEVLVVDSRAEGIGIGAALVAAAEAAARERGALSVTLHVFATNGRARRVYERLGYTGELIRYIKHLV
ncbi:MAG: hypothetical protein Kow0031_33800 [Anaerolineae bacterium]